MPTGLLLLAQGSPDPRHAQTMHAVADDVRGDVEAHVALGFLDHDVPTVAEAVKELSQDNRRVVAVQVRLGASPLQQDVARALAHAPAHRPVDDAGPLGLGPWLVPLLERRAVAAGAPSGEDVVVVLAASDEATAELAGDVAHQWSALRRSPVVTTTVDGTGRTTEPGHRSELGTVLDELLANGQRVVVVPLMLEPGSGYDLLVAEGRARGVAVAEVLAPAQELTDHIVTLARGQVVLPDVSVPA